METENATSAVDRSETERAEVVLPRKLASELVGTFFLTLVGAGIEVVAAMKPGQIDRSVKALAPGFVVAAMIYAMGDVSGAHLNPVVTLVFAIRRSFPWREVPLYWIAQVSGALLAAVTLRCLFGTVREVGINPLDGLSGVKGCVVEAILTCLLVVVILNAADKHSLIGAQAALAVGATVAVCGMLGGELTTTSMNPARSIGPAIAAANVTDLWVYVAGPTLGALAGLGIVSILRPRRNPDEHRAAEGETR